MFKANLILNKIPNANTKNDNKKANFIFCFFFIASNFKLNYEKNKFVVNFYSKIFMTIENFIKFSSNRHAQFISEIII